MGAQGSDNVHGENGVQALHPVESGSHHSINSECLAVILVRVTVIDTVYFNTWLAHITPKFQKLEAETRAN